MKKAILILTTVLCLSACSKTDGGAYGGGSGTSTGGGGGTSTGGGSGSSRCGTYRGKALYKGSNGGCYYINPSGNKVYVERSACRC